MKALGLDLGSKTLGIAISDKFRMLASTYDTLRFDEEDYDYAIDKTIEIVKKEKVDVIVLGYPKHMNGDIGVRAKLSESFKDKLQSIYNIEIVLWDERLSSKEVDRIMISGNLSRNKRKSKKDELAAVVILQGYLDMKK